MNQINYQRQMDQLLEQFAEEERVPTLLLHSCCAPCSSYVLEYLAQHFHIIDFFYNPNIFPPEEYEKRVREIEGLILEKMAPRFRYDVELVEGVYEPERFFDMARGLEKLPEGGERCFSCFRMRLEEAAIEAKKRGADYFATTLTISPLKNAAKINEIGEELEQKYGVRYLASDFKKKNGYRRSCELSKEYELYRQNYCGCVFSKNQSPVFTEADGESKIEHRVQKQY